MKLGLLVVSMVLCLVTGPAIFAPRPAFGAPAKPAQASLGVMVDPAITTPSATVGIYSAGALNATDAPPLIAHTFTLRNSGTATLTINRLRPSCGCTSATLSVGAKSATAGATVLAPGKSASVRVEVRPEGMLSGDFEKFVWVYVKGGVQPAATLEMKATFPPAVVLAPASLDFGTVAAGAGAALTVDALLSPRVDTPQTVLTLTSSLSFVHVGPPASAGEAPSPIGGADKWRRFRFTVMLSPDAPAGVFAGDLLASITRFEPVGGVTQMPLPNTQVGVHGRLVKP